LTTKGIDLLKHDGNLGKVRGLLRQIVANRDSELCREIVDAIERDKITAVKALGDQKADPSPLASTMFATEAAALQGCATPAVGGKLLYSLVRALKPMNVIEIGTAHGYGALYIGAALRENGKGKLFTLEGMTARIRLSKAAIARFDLNTYVEVVAGDFAETFPRALQAVRPLDLIFSDGNKDPLMTRNQFELALNCMRRGHMFFDDIDFSEPIAELWQDIVANERVSTCLTFDQRWGLLRLRP
jgi:predicted O-methyltransferase YrrM